MGKKEEILEYCMKIRKPVTVVQIIDAICPGKLQPYLNSYVTSLVQEKRLVRNDNVRPYTVRLPAEGEVIDNVKEYSRQGGWTNNHTSKRDDIIKPCPADAEKYIRGWEQLENYKLQERALDKLFFKAFPNNKEIEGILVKVACLNEFYSTNIFDVYPVAKHILELDIDDRLKDGDTSLVNDIAVLIRSDGSKINNYSFATKYCSHHNPDEYAIYDSFVDAVLRYFKDIDGFAEFGKDDLRDYASFKSILLQFRAYYGLEEYNLKLLDRYLWQFGKDKFPKKYYNKGVS